MNNSELHLFRKKYGLSATTVENLRSEIKSKMSELHPDRNAGTFINKQAEDTFHRLQEAKEELDSTEHANDKLIPASLFGDIAVLLNTQQSALKKEAIEDRFDKTLNERVTQSKKKYLFPKLGLTSITAIVTFVWLFPNTIKEHPILSHYIDISSSKFSLLWLTAIICTITFWAWSFIIEQKRNELYSALKLEHFQNELFERFIIWFYRNSYSQTMETRRFSKTDFINFLTVGIARRVFRDASSVYDSQGVRWASDSTLHLNRLISTKIDDDLAASMADMIFARVELNGVIRRCDERSLSKKYEIVDNTELANKALPLGD